MDFFVCLDETSGSWREVAIRGGSTVYIKVSRGGGVGSGIPKYLN